MSETSKDADSTQPDFWSERYASGRTPWQLEHLPARLVAFIESLPAGNSVLVPGCGEDYRTLDAFQKRGCQITAIDFSPVAIEQVRKALPQMTERIIFGEFFRHDIGSACFDIVYERTFLCSLPPRLWQRYAARVAQLLRPRGLLAGFFFYGDEPDPPPFSLDESTAAKIFDNRFELRKSEPVTDSLSIFAGKEKWQEWQLRS